jgi:hypothetical protein
MRRPVWGKPEQRFALEQRSAPRRGPLDEQATSDWQLSEIRPVRTALRVGLASWRSQDQVDALPRRVGHPRFVPSPARPILRALTKLRPRTSRQERRKPRLPGCTIPGVLQGSLRALRGLHLRSIRGKQKPCRRSCGEGPLDFVIRASPCGRSASPRLGSCPRKSLYKIDHQFPSRSLH